jgi:DNA repair photolyase
VLFRPVANPPNPFASTEVDYLDGEAPHASLEVFEDHSRTILSRNDSPDLGFTWSVNPYRGCFHACAYCLSADTPVLMADGTRKAIGDVRVGESIYGTSFDGKYRRYRRTLVLNRWDTVKAAYRLALEDGTTLVASGDHRFLTRRGWKHVANARGQRPHLTVNDKLLGVGALAPGPSETDDYKRGYLCGLIRGDALLKVFRYQRAGRSHGDQYHFRLALIDLEPLQRARSYLAEQSVQTHEFVFAEATTRRHRMVGIRSQARSSFERIEEICAWPERAGLDWSKGFLAGIFDAEGSYSRGILRISNGDERILAETLGSLARLGFDAVLERPEQHVSNVRVRGGLREHLRFMHTVGTAITRKRDIDGQAIKSTAKLRVVSVELLGVDLPMVDITTGTGDFIANGVVSHNCYARPTHEYLSFGAGTDFERKIVVKPRAPELLREAFDKPSWRGELVVFSGVTDCYQPLEASYRLTRGCLEVCAEYKNPAGIVTKSPLIERDVDVLAELARVGQLGVMISVPFWDPAKARAMEPFVATPRRRVHAIEKLAKAGIEVGVNVAPIIPGLSDEEIPDILRAAKDAGATRAGRVLLRLPGPVKDVFEERVRATLPLRAEKILRRIRDTRGGKMNDSRFGSRQKGEGVYAETIERLFDETARRLGFEVHQMGGTEERERPTTFERPEKKGPQLTLF